MNESESGPFPSRVTLREESQWKEPSADKRFRVGLVPSVAKALIVLVVALATVGLLRVVFPSRPETVQAFEGRQSHAESQTQSNSILREPEVEAQIVVFVTGEVNSPGVVSVPADSRLEVAISAAGGLTPEADLVSVNLARLIKDGEHIHVVAQGEEAPTATDDPDGGIQGEPTCIDLNTATQQQLETLDGVGPKTASRILEQRQAVGGFQSSEELLAISGIGQKLYGRISAGLCGE